jgi:hypothetical protein
MPPLGNRQYPPFGAPFVPREVTFAIASRVASDPRAQITIGPIIVVERLNHVTRALQVPCALPGV